MTLSGSAASSFFLSQQHSQAYFTVTSGTEPVIISLSWHCPNAWSMPLSSDLLMLSGIILRAKWAWEVRWRFLPLGTTWWQIKIIKQELSLGAWSSGSQSRGGTDDTLHLRQPKQRTIIPCKHTFNLIFGPDRAILHGSLPFVSL